MAILQNKTGLAGELFPTQGSSGRLYIVMVVRGTFQIEVGRALRRCEVQEPVCTSDSYFGDPDNSSLKSASDLAPVKPGTDVVMMGSAHAPRGRATTTMLVEVNVGPMEKKVRIVGDREWSRTLGAFPTITAPKPFLTMPLVYERAFGGRDNSHGDTSKHDWERRNPVGKGFRVHKSVSGLALPNLEVPGQAMSSTSDRPAPQAFGFIDRSWQPRAGFAGTYDENWQKNQCPLPPSDLDNRYFHTVSTDQICRPHLRGDEPVRMVGAAPEGVIDFALPGVVVGVSVDFRHGNPRPGIARLDTVELRPDEQKVSLVWRLAIRCPRKIFDVELVTAFLVRLGTALQIVPTLRNAIPESHERFIW
jgi:hypothetical protein